MRTKILFEADGKVFLGELNDSALAQRVIAKLPAKCRMSRWGDEYYGAIDLAAELEGETSEVVAEGTIAYWPPGDALCIFFGPTPASEGQEPRAASPVALLGEIVSDNLNELRDLAGSVEFSITVE